MTNQSQLYKGFIISIECNRRPGKYIPTAILRKSKGSSIVSRNVYCKKEFSNKKEATDYAIKYAQEYIENGKANNM